MQAIAVESNQAAQGTVTAGFVAADVSAAPLREAARFVEADGFKPGARIEPCVVRNVTEEQDAIKRNPDLESAEYNQMSSQCCCALA
jgi:hypothetical protein